MTIKESSGTLVTEASGAKNTDTCTVVLNTESTASVSVAIANLSEILSSVPSAATVTPGALTFTTTNWANPANDNGEAERCG